MRSSNKQPKVYNVVSWICSQQGHRFHDCKESQPSIFSVMVAVRRELKFMNVVSAGLEEQAPWWREIMRQGGTRCPTFLSHMWGVLIKSDEKCWPLLRLGLRAINCADCVLRINDPICMWRSLNGPWSAYLIQVLREQFWVDLVGHWLKDNFRYENRTFETLWSQIVKDAPS